MKTYLIYENSQFFLALIRKFGDKSLLLHEEQIGVFALSKADNMNEIKNITDKIKQSYEMLCDEFNIKNNEITFLYSPLSYYYNTDSFLKDFETETEFNIEDINRLKNYAKEFEKVEDKYSVVDFDIKKIFSDNQEIKYGTNVRGKKLEITGDLIVSDKKSYEVLINIVRSTGLKINKISVIEYYLKNQLREDGDALICVEKESNKFMGLNEGLVKSFTLNLGTIKMIEQLYTELHKIMPSTDAEEVARKFQKTWFLETYDYDYDIITGVDIKLVTKIAQEVFRDFYSYIFSEINKQKINISNLAIAFSDISECTLKKALKENLKIESHSMFGNNPFASELISAKASYVIKEIEKYEEG